MGEGIRSPRRVAMTRGKKAKEPPAAALVKDQVKKWISRKSRFAAAQAPAGRGVDKSVPQRQTERPCPVLTCAAKDSYKKVSTPTIEKAKSVVVPSAHDLAKKGSSDLDGALLVTWLGIIAHGKLVHTRDDQISTRFDAAVRAMKAAVAFSADFCNKHNRIVKELKVVAASSGSQWRIAE